MTFAKKVTNAIKQTESDLDETRTIEPDIGSPPIEWDRNAWFGSRLGITGGGGSLSEVEFPYDAITRSLIPADDGADSSTGISLGQEYTANPDGTEPKRWYQIIGNILKVNSIQVAQTSNTADTHISLSASISPTSTLYSLASGLASFRTVGTETLRLSYISQPVRDDFRHIIPNTALLFLDSGDNNKLKLLRYGTQTAEEIGGASSDFDPSDITQNLIPGLTDSDQSRNLDIGSTTQQWNRMFSNQFVFRQQSANPSDPGSTNVVLYYRTGTGWQYKRGDNNPQSFSSFDPTRSPTILPEDSTTNLGSANKDWEHIYFSGNIELEPTRGVGDQRIGTSRSAVVTSSTMWSALNHIYTIHTHANNLLPYDTRKNWSKSITDSTRWSHTHIEVFANLVPDTDSTTDATPSTITGSDKVAGFNLGWTDAHWKGVYAESLYLAKSHDSGNVPTDRIMLFYDDDGDVLKYKVGSDDPVAFGGVDLSAVSQDIVPDNSAIVPSQTPNRHLGKASKYWGNLYIEHVYVRENIEPEATAADSGVDSRIGDHRNRATGSGIQHKHFNHVYQYWANTNKLRPYDQFKNWRIGTSNSSTHKHTHIEVFANLVPNTDATLSNIDERTVVDSAGSTLVSGSFTYSGESFTGTKIGNHDIGWHDAFWGNVFAQNHWFSDISDSSVASPPSNSKRVVLYWTGTEFRYRTPGASSSTRFAASWTGGSVTNHVYPNTNHTLNLGRNGNWWAGIYGGVLILDYASGRTTRPPDANSVAIYCDMEGNLKYQKRSGGEQNLIGGSWNGGTVSQDIDPSNSNINIGDRSNEFKAVYTRLIAGEKTTTNTAGDIQIGASSTDQIGFSGVIEDNLIPDSSSQLGTSSARWKWIYGDTGNFNTLWVGTTQITGSGGGQFTGSNLPSLYPASNRNDIGSTGALRWDDLYIENIYASDSITCQDISCDDINGDDMTFDTVRCRNLTVTGTATGNFGGGGSTTWSGGTVRGTATFSADVTFNEDVRFGSSPGDRVYFTSRIDSSIIPYNLASSLASRRNRDLGSTTRNWENIYAETIDIDDTMKTENILIRQTTSDWTPDWNDVPNGGIILYSVDGVLTYRAKNFRGTRSSGTLS